MKVSIRIMYFGRMDTNRKCQTCPAKYKFLFFTVWTEDFSQYFIVINNTKVFILPFSFLSERSFLLVERKPKVVDLFSTILENCVVSADPLYIFVSLKVYLDTWRSWSYDQPFVQCSQYDFRYLLNIWLG